MSKMTCEMAARGCAAAADSSAPADAMGAPRRASERDLGVDG